jgi:hypothetical protein
MRTTPGIYQRGFAKNEGQWVDAAGMFRRRIRGPVYKLLGEDLGTAEFPPMETPLTNGEIAFASTAGGTPRGQTGQHLLCGQAGIFNKYFSDIHKLLLSVWRTLWQGS